MQAKTTEHIWAYAFEQVPLVDVGYALILIATAVKTCIKNSGAGDELLKYNIGNGDMLGTYN